MRQAIARAAGCREQQAARLPATTPARGPPGAPLKRLPGQDATPKTETFRFTTRNAHGWEAKGGETSGAALCLQKEQLRPLLQT